jgi:sec-independent protein translocase protein TatA
MPSHWELIILAIALVLIFGSKRLPEIGRSLGRGARELKQTVSEVDPRQDLKRVLEDDQPEKPADARPPGEPR